MAEISLHAYLDYLEDRLSRDAYSEVVAHCRHILESYPKHLETYKLLARALSAQDEAQDALDLFQRVLSSNPNDFIAHIGMSDSYRESNALAQAIWHLERAFEQVPNNLDLQEEIKKLYEQRGERAPRKIHLTSGALARMYLKGKLYDQAIAEIRAGIAKDPERLDLQVLLGEALWDSHQEVNAGKVAAEILKRLPYSIDANRILAQLWLKYNRPTEARPFLERVGEMDPAMRYRLEHNGQEPTGETFRLMMLEFRPEQFAAQSGAADWVSQIGAIEKQKGVTGPLEMPRSSSITDIFAKPTAEPSDSTPAEEMPDWLKSAITGDSGQSAPKQPAQTMPLSSGEEEPDWLKDALGKTSAPAAPSTSLGEDEPPSWLQDALGQTPAPAATPPAMPVDDSPTPDWLQDAISQPPTATASPVTAAMGSTPEDTPDWLQEALTGGPTLTEPPPRMEASSAPPAPAAPITDDVPEWLADIRSEEKRTPTAADLPISVDDSEVPSWLNDILSDKPGAAPAAAARPAAEPESPGVVSDDWLDNFLAGGPPITTTGAPQETATRPEPQEMPAPVASERSKPGTAGLETWDDVPAASWLEESDLAAAEQDDEALPDWLTSAPQASQPQPAMAAPAPSDSDDDDLPDWLSGIVSSTTTEQSRPETAQDEIPSWLQGSQAEAPSSTEPLNPRSVEEDEELPAWLQGSREVQSGLGEMPAQREEADSSIPDWLGGTAAPARAEQPASVGASDDDELPAWLAGAGKEDDSATLPDWLGGTSTPSQAAPASASMVDEDEDEELPAWLGGSAKEETVSETPDWLAEKPVASAVPAASSDDDAALPDWLGGGTSQTEEGEEDWLSQLNIGGAPKASEPAPAAARIENEPDWLSELTGGAAASEADEDEDEELPAWMSESAAPEADNEDLSWLTQSRQSKPQETEDLSWMSSSSPAKSDEEDLSWMTQGSPAATTEPAEPDWMSELNTAERSETETAPAASMTPDWMSSDDEDEDDAGESEEEAPVVAQQASAPAAISLPSWLDEDDDEEEEITAEVEETPPAKPQLAQTDWLTSALAPTRALPPLDTLPGDDDEYATRKELFVDNETPDWLKMMGGQQEEASEDVVASQEAGASQDREEEPAQLFDGQDEPEPVTAELPVLEEEPAVASDDQPMGDEIPSWMLDGDLDSDDAVKWLEEIAQKYDPSFVKEGEEAPAQEPVAEAAESPKAEESDDTPSWLKDEPAAAQADEEELPSWLRDEEAAEELPSWLRTDDEETPAAAPAASAAQNGSDDELSWLDSEVTAQGVSPSAVISEALTPDHPPVSAPPPRPPDSEAEPVSDDDLPEWLRGEDIEVEMAKAGPSSEYGDLPDLDVEDDELEWLDSALKAEEGTSTASLDADFDKLLAEEDEEEELPSWLSGDAEKTEEPAMASTPAAAAEEEDEEEEALPDWLSGMDSETETAAAPAAVSAPEPEPEPPAPQPEPEPVRMEAPAPVAAPTPAPSDEDALPAWLSGSGESVDTGLDEFLKAAVPAASKEPVEAPQAPAAPEPPKPAPLPVTGPLAPPPAAMPSMMPAAAASAPAGGGDLSGARQKMTDGYAAESLNAYEELVQAGQSLDETIVDLSEYVKGRRVDPRAYRIMGDAMMGQGRLQDALDMYRKALDQY